jgi:hypothetical protein
MVFKSAGIMSSTNTMNINVESTSKFKYKVMYNCTHCGRDGHKVDFCFRLAEQQRKERAKAKSNFRSSHFVSREDMTPHFVHRV